MVVGLNVVATADSTTTTSSAFSSGKSKDSAAIGTSHIEIDNRIVLENSKIQLLEWASFYLSETILGPSKHVASGVECIGLILQLLRDDIPLKQLF